MPVHAPGARIGGRFEVAGRPMIGGMGIVYVCLDLREDRPVALKTFRPEFLPNRSARDRFLREGTRWVELGCHPHVVRCHEVFKTQVGDEIYLVLELVAKEHGHDDTSLRSWLTPGVPLAVGQALLFALQIARGMQHAVETIAGFVHRDLKPENLLVGAEGLTGTSINRLRVTDFGLASVLAGASGQLSGGGGQQTKDSKSVGRTQLTRGMVGTPLYMAPEQWRGDAVTAATDVYALGCILYEMLAGRRAVAGQSLETLRRAHCEGQRQSLPGGVAREVRELVSRCLAVEPMSRFAGWARVEVALETAYRALVGSLPPILAQAESLRRDERVAAGWSYNAIGASYMDIGNPTAAASCFRKAADVGRVEGDLYMEAATLGNLGTAFVVLGDPQRAIGYHKQHLGIARRMGYRHGEGRALVGLGGAFVELGDVRRAIGCLEQCLTICREVGDPKGEENALKGLGNAFLRLGDVKRALSCYVQSLALARDIGDRRREGGALGNLGIVYRQLGDTRRAIAYYEQALAISREIGDWGGEAFALGNLGRSHLDLDALDQAARYYEQAYVIACGIGDQRAQGQVLEGMGATCYQLGEVEQAFEYWQRAIQIFDMIGTSSDSASVKTNLALLLARQERYADAWSYAKQATEVYVEMSHPKLERAQGILAVIEQALLLLTLESERES